MALLSATGAPLIDVDTIDPQADMPDLWEDLASWVDTRSAPRFPGEADRNATLAGLGPSDKGRLAMVGDALTVWTGAGWATLAQASTARWTAYAAKVYDAGGSPLQADQIVAGIQNMDAAYQMLSSSTCAFRARFQVTAAKLAGTRYLAIALPRRARATQYPLAASWVRGGGNNPYCGVAVVSGEVDGTNVVLITKADGTGYLRTAAETQGGGASGWVAGDSVSIGGTFEIRDA